MDSLNVVALTGHLERDPVMRFDPDSSTPRCSGTLRCEEVNANGSTFRLYVPLEGWGKTAEALGELHAGALVAVQGKLCWRKYTTKHGEEKGSLAVLVGKVSVLASAAIEAAG
jgi:single-stranded DNA-binding protein